MADESKNIKKWRRKPFSLENKRTGEMLDFARFSGNNGKLLLLLHRHPKVGPLQSIQRMFNVVNNRNDKICSLKFHNAKIRVVPLKKTTKPSVTYTHYNPFISSFSPFITISQVDVPLFE